ncbi:hypothetical protein Y1Q_0020906 [Alligator mississippiensis]|uniref:Uncharacterized protein n=1 Tax=Alligator mississippiensis TaxID=8496 RepID=A0A151NJA7_ALLMI|nr:hypothetical protein Y1Q_0020906 [Alligator mississippiensis]
MESSALQSVQFVKERYGESSVKAVVYYCFEFSYGTEKKPQGDQKMSIRKAAPSLLLPTSQILEYQVSGL